MAREIKLAKGVKDWYGRDAILRNKIRDTLRRVFERYGYDPIETPMFERIETISKKGGGEIQKEVFRLQDQGRRELALRFDQTVPLARFVASHNDVTIPFKRYVIGEVFRDGPTQPEQGRYRIFTQCDVDILGVKEMTAEVELLCLARDAFKELGLGDVEVKINNRKLLDGVLDHAGVPKDARLPTIITLDKVDKIGFDGVASELKKMVCEGLLSDDAVSKIMDSVVMGSDNAVTYARLAKVVDSQNGVEGLGEVKTLLDYSDSLGLDFVHLDPCLARGLDYYTGTTIEVYLKDKSLCKSAILAGGRFDNMVGEFRGGDIPAVGFSFGLERLVMVMGDIADAAKTVADIYLVPVGDTALECLGVADTLRGQGVNVYLELKKHKLGKSFAFAERLGVRYVGIVGETEISNGEVALKNLETRVQTSVPIGRVGKYILHPDGEGRE